MFDIPKFNGSHVGDVKDLPRSALETLELAKAAFEMVPSLLLIINEQQLSVFTSALVSLMANEIATLAVATSGGDRRFIDATLSIAQIIMKNHAEMHMQRVERRIPASALAERDKRVAALSDDELYARFDQASAALAAVFAKATKPNSPPAA